MQQQQQMQPHTGSYPSHNITTEIIQKYLDENKQLILAILENQNLGKMNECAAYQAKLQANLMYLAAIADSQPQGPPVHPQVLPTAIMPGGVPYVSQQQVQQQIAQQQALMAARNPLQFTQPLMPHVTPQHQQQAVAAHYAMTAGASGLGIQSGPAPGVNPSLGTGVFSDYSRAASTGEDLQISRGMGAEMRVSNRSDGSGSESVHRSITGGNVMAQKEDSEASYLKGPEEDGNGV